MVVLYPSCSCWSKLRPPVNSFEAFDHCWTLGVSHTKRPMECCCFFCWGLDRHKISDILSNLEQLARHLMWSSAMFCCLEDHMPPHMTPPNICWASGCRQTSSARRCQNSSGMEPGHLGPLGQLETATWAGVSSITRTVILSHWAWLVTKVTTSQLLLSLT